APEADQHAVAINRDHGVAVSPFAARFVERDRVCLRIEMLPRTPLPDSLPIAVDFDHRVCPHTVVLRACEPALHSRGELRRYLAEPEVDSPARLRSPCIVVLDGVAVLPDDVPLPVELGHNAAA